MGPDTGSDVRVFGKDSTIIINVGDNQKVKALEVMRDIEQLYGKGMVYACVPKSGDCFEVTLANKAMADKLTTGVTIQDSISIAICYTATPLWCPLCIYPHT